MKHMSLAVTLAVLAGLAACSESPTAVTAERTAEPTAAFAKGGDGGGVGSPHFTIDGTSCTVEPWSGVTSCAFQIAGLGKNGSAVVALDGILDVTFDCVDKYGTVKASRSTVRIFVDGTFFANASGNATGTLSDGPDIPITAFTCPITTWLYSPANVIYNLQPTGKNGLPVSAGEWSLGAIAKTAKGSGKAFFFVGPITVIEPS